MFYQYQLFKKIDKLGLSRDKLSSDCYWNWVLLGLSFAKIRPSPSSSFRWPELSLISNSSPPPTQPPTRPGKYIWATILEEPDWYLGVAGVNSCQYCQAQLTPSPSWLRLALFSAFLGHHQTRKVLPSLAECCSPVKLPPPATAEWISSPS